MYICVHQLTQTNYICSLFPCEAYTREPRLRVYVAGHVESMLFLSHLVVANWTHVFVQESTFSHVTSYIYICTGTGTHIVHKDHLPLLQYCVCAKMPYLSQTHIHKPRFNFGTLSTVQCHKKNAIYLRNSDGWALSVSTRKPIFLLATFRFR